MNLPFSKLTGAEKIHRQIEVEADPEDLFRFLVDPELRQKWARFSYCGRHERDEHNSVIEDEVRTYYVDIPLPFLHGRQSLQERIDTNEEDLSFQSQLTLYGERSNNSVDLLGHVEAREDEPGLAVATVSIALNGALRVCRSRIERAIDTRIPHYIETIEERVADLPHIKQAS